MANLLNDRPTSTASILHKHLFDKAGQVADSACVRTYVRTYIHVHNVYFYLKSCGITKKFVCLYSLEVVLYLTTCVTNTRLLQV